MSKHLGLMARIKPGQGHEERAALEGAPRVNNRNLPDCYFRVGFPTPIVCLADADSEGVQAMVERTTRPLARRAVIVDDERGQATTVGGRAVAAIDRYVQELLPPFAAALTRYDRDREYSCPW